MVAELTQGGAEISRDLTYLAPVKEIHFKPATLKVESTGEIMEVSRSELHRPFWRQHSISSFGDTRSLKVTDDIKISE